MCFILVANTAHAGDKCNDKVDALFPELTGDGDDGGVSEIESLCLSCYKQVQYVMCPSTTMKSIDQCFEKYRSVYIMVT